MPEPRRAEVTVTKSSCWGVQEPPCLRATIFFLSFYLSHHPHPPVTHPPEATTHRGARGCTPTVGLTPMVRKVSSAQEFVCTMAILNKEEGRGSVLTA